MKLAATLLSLFLVVSVVFAQENMTDVEDPMTDAMNGTMAPMPDEGETSAPDGSTSDAMTASLTTLVALATAGAAAAVAWV